MVTLPRDYIPSIHLQNKPENKQIKSEQDRCHLKWSRFGLIVTTIQLENEELQQKQCRVSKY